MPGMPVRRARKQQREAEERKVQKQRAFDSLPSGPMEDGKRKSLVRKELKYLARYYFKGDDGEPYELEEYHLEILDAMFEGGKLVINLPTDHMKSSLGCFLFPLFSLMDDPDQTHIICGANLEDSKRRLHKLALELTTNELLLEDYPWMARPEDRDGRLWTATRFNVAGRTINKPNPSVLASAVGANELKGRRGKLVMDDVEGEDVRWSPTKREQLYSWLTLEAWRCYEDRKDSVRPLQCLMGTPFDVDSIYFKMERHGWKVIRHACYLDGGLVPDNPELDTWGRPMMDKRVYLWPRKASKVEEARRSLRALPFAIAYLMDPTGGDKTKLSSEQIQQRMSDAEAISSDQVARFVCLDPAGGGGGKRVDYAGIAVVKIDWKPGEQMPQVDLLECHDFQQGLFEQVHLCADLSKRHAWTDDQGQAHPLPVLYEGSSQQGPTYQNAFMHLHPEVKVLRYYPSDTSKFDTSMGLTVIKRLVLEGRLAVPASQLESEGVQALIEEVRNLAPPFRLHDHISMAIWFAVRYVYEKVRHYAAPPIRLTYALNPIQQAREIWDYEDDPTLSQLERAYRAIGYDRTARQGAPLVVGYTAFRRQQMMPWEQDIKAEEERFQEALRRRRGA